ncbi:NAD-binding protein [Neobacillus cucumis]|uniref:RCK N-terminal domain-containing protein n=1 Tax=Neobacillus cucumis TaxID=1740721 RepID=A0A2N5H9Y2_9BACI|nr:NAD-binding protein [Neobacillus cucumis]PLS02337.1 hypothetical protein CVD27_20365 [Neobacillus cucumis]
MKKLVDQHLAKVIFTAFAIIILLCIWGFYFISGTPSLTLTALLTIDLVAYVSVFYTGLIKKNRLQVLMFLVAVTTGFYGFKFLAIKEYSVLNSMYSTFRLFLLDLDPVFPEDGSVFTRYPLAVEIARWSAAAYTISTLFSIIYSLFNQKIRLIWYGILGKHIVVSGFHKKSMTLVENLKKEDKKVVLLAEEISEAQRSYLQELGVIVFAGRQGDPSLYKKSKLQRAEYFIIYHEDDSRNLNEILALNHYVNNKRSLLHMKQVIFHLESHQSMELFEDLEKELDFHTNVSLKPINVHRLIANELFDQIPLYKNYEKRVRDPQGEPLHLLFIGFGQTGQQLAVQAIERSAFLTKKLLKITVLDKNAGRVKKEWEDNYPNSKMVVDIQFHSMNIEIESTFDFLKKQPLAFTHLFVCLKEDSHDLKEGIRLAKKISDIPIFLKVNEEAEISLWLHRHEGKYHNLHLFGNHDMILTYDYVINDQLEDLAKKVHESYQKSKELESNTKQKEWRELSTFTKESNRNQITHAFTKLMLLGLKAVPVYEESKSGLGAVTELEFKAEAKKLLEPIAEAEHKRWNIFHFLRGWDILEDISNGIKDTDKKLHGCLVTYNDLMKIYELTGEDYQKYDRDVVLDLHDTMKRLGYKIVKDSWK